jgi:hypothetical protein
MEYKKDLLKNNGKSIFRLILGIFMCVISILWIFARLAENDLIRPFDWIYSGFFALSLSSNRIFQQIISPIHFKAGSSVIPGNNQEDRFV